jgi:hypothetical protein
MTSPNSRPSSVNSARQSTATQKNAESGVWQGLSFLSPSLAQGDRGKLISPRYVRDQGNTRRTVEPDYPAAPPPKAPRKKLIPSFEHQSQVFKDGGDVRSPGRRYGLGRVPKEGGELKKNRASPDNTLARVIQEPYSPPPQPVRA